jgi:hypothetical protein
MPIRIIRHILLLLKKLLLAGKKSISTEIKKMGFDAKWHKVPFRVQQVITNNLWDINGETLVTVVKKDKFSLISWFEQFKKKKYGSR